MALLHFPQNKGILIQGGCFNFISSPRVWWNRMFVIPLIITSKHGYNDSVSGFGVKLTFSSGQGFSFSSLLWLQHWSFHVPAPAVVQHLEVLEQSLLYISQNWCIVSKQIISGEGAVMWCSSSLELNANSHVTQWRQWSSQIFLKSLQLKHLA